MAQQNNGLFAVIPPQLLGQWPTTATFNLRQSKLIMNSALCNPAAKACVLVVEDQAQTRRSLVRFLNRQADLTCHGEAYHESRILATVLSQKPDLVLLDIPCGQEDRIQLIKSLRTHIPRVHLLVISPHQE